MGKYGGINKKRADRIKEVMEELNISQTDISDLNKDLPAGTRPFNITYISDMLRGEKPITDKSIARLKAICPKLDNIREQWLLGYDDCKTETEYALRQASKNYYDSDDRFLGLKQFLEAYGYLFFRSIIGSVDPKGILSEEDAEITINEEMNTSYMICKGEDAWHLSKEEFNIFADDTMQILAVLINKLPK